MILTLEKYLVNMLTPVEHPPYITVMGQHPDHHTNSNLTVIVLNLHSVVDSKAQQDNSNIQNVYHNVIPSVLLLVGKVGAES